jgi:DNA-binding response OmpR family regulator
VTGLTGRISPMPPEYRSPRPRVLLVDDDPRLVHIVGLYLQVQHLEVITADCGEVALEKLERGMPDLIISDVMMPGIDGIELCREIRGMPGGGELPIIMFTALSSEENRRQAMDAGADQVIAKPFNLVGLGQAVKALLPNHAERASA